MTKNESKTTESKKIIDNRKLDVGGEGGGGVTTGAAEPVTSATAKEEDAVRVDVPLEAVETGEEARRKSWECCVRLDEGLLMGKLMETEMTLRLKFESGKELRTVQDKVWKALAFLKDLSQIAKKIELLEGVIS